MKTLNKRVLHGAAVSLGLLGAPLMAQVLNFAQAPLFLGSTVKPNVLVVYDNSQSMDGTMAGMLIAGNDASTRGNIARSVLRDTITSYRGTFQWGLGSFGVKNSGLYTTYAYYFGADNQVVYTNDCVNGVSASNAGLRCIANPENGNGFNFITYLRAGDDPSINDILYTGDYGNQFYGIGLNNNSTSYKAYKNHNANAGTGWASGSFSNLLGTLNFTPTDAGFLPTTPPYNRQFWIKRAWGYNADITGAGVINEVVSADSTTHYNNLMGLLAPETSSTISTELKNSAVFTPLAGTLKTVRDYFGNSLSGKSTPISQTCQKNFVLLATDGNPTGKTNGSMYSLADQVNTYAPLTNTWTFSTAANDVFAGITNLRTTAYNSRNYDIQTYVVGLGDSVANASSVATLNRMAQLGGTDNAYLASDQTALANAFRAISIDIISRTAAASSVSLNSGSWNAGSKVYQGRFSSSDWSGQLLAYPVGTDGSANSTADWDAAQKVNTQNWNTDRQVITYKPSAALGARGVPFRWPANAASPGPAEIDADMVTALNKSGAGAVDGYGSQRLEFLRGNATREERNCANCPAPVFRSRPVSVLGDIVNSAPVYVGGATGEFRDTMETARYTTYANTRAAQSPVIYVGANDGMLHAFNASNGNELFAYVPWAVRNKLSSLTSNPYNHLFTVDGSPAVGDVFVGGAWKTLLVSGMNAGAPGLFALDVSSPSSFTEASAASVVRWEVGDADGDVGYIFGRPLLIKMRDGKWRAITGNGYNSANGHAVLLLVDLETGAVTRIDTGVGSAGTPNGLSPVAVVSSSDNNVADIVYAGDLYGNLWKFDLSSTSSSGWKVAYSVSGVNKPLFAATSGQPITARPDVTRFPKGGYIVSVGTGRYVDIGDNAAGSTQTLYGIWDNGSTVSASDLQTQTVVNTVTDGSGNTYRQSTHAVGPADDTAIAGDNAISLANYYSTKKGWKLDLPSSGERVVAESTVRSGRLGISTMIPSAAVCSFGGDGWLLEVDVVTGNRTSAFDTNNDNVVGTGDRLSGTLVSGVRIGAVPSAATVLRGSGSSKGIEYKLITTSDGGIRKQPVAAKTLTSRRGAWEQLQ
jgi:type IV pilus assembly protein PilY1